MTELEMRAVCEREGVTPRWVMRRKRRYLYVARRFAGLMRDRYVCPADQLDWLTEEQLLVRIRALLQKGAAR